jgi:hypothetical protein
MGIDRRERDIRRSAHRGAIFPIATPRIFAESDVSFECRLMQIIQLGEMRSLVLGEVLALHVSDCAVLDAERCWIDTTGLGLVSRGGANSYVRAAEVIDLPGRTAGMPQGCSNASRTLCRSIRNSILTGCRRSRQEIRFRKKILQHR